MCPNRISIVHIFEYSASAARTFVHSFACYSMLYNVIVAIEYIRGACISGYKCKSSRKNYSVSRYIIIRRCIAHQLEERAAESIHALLALCIVHKFNILSASIVGARKNIPSAQNGCTVVKITKNFYLCVWVCVFYEQA